MNADSQELRAALAVALAAHGARGPADAAQVDTIVEYARLAEAAWRIWRTPERGAPRGLLAALLLPGRTALLLTPPPEVCGIEAGVQEQLLRDALADLAGLGLHYVQALVEPPDEASAALLRGVDFAELARMLYFERDARFPWVDPPERSAATWRSFTEERAGEFESVLARTYEESLDCPELTGTRPMSDVLRAHRASGHFRPAGWEICLMDGAAAGCVLLGELPHLRAMEIVYMGAAPEWRGRGVGELLLRRALEQARRFGAARVTLAADARNVPARKLYERFGFAVVAERAAYFWGARRA